MWKFLYQLASPKYFYCFVERMLPYTRILCFFGIATGLSWGLWFTPADYQQGDAFRIIYVHVPCAFMSMSLYALMGFLAFLYLIWHIKLAGMVLKASARLGAMMAFLALVTGSLWGKPMWGTWWIWDARLTSELILLFLYVAIIIVSHAFKNMEQSEKLAAILTLVGLIDLPIIHYSVYWWNTLHQGATLTVFSKPKIELSMLYPLLLSLFGFLFYCIHSVLLTTQTELLSRDKHKSWLKFLQEKTSI